MLLSGTGIPQVNDVRLTDKSFNPFFTKLAGTEKLQEQIEQGLSQKQIRKTWEKDLEVFKKIRGQYLIYE